MALKKILYAFAFVATTFTAYSQISKGGFKLEESNEKLPEILLSFDAIYDNVKVELTWSSNTELNNNLYVVERSKDAMNFEAVTSVKSFGNNSNLISYFDVDNTPYEGKSYYRLTQVDKNGTVLSSRLVSVNNTSTANNSQQAINQEELTNQTNTANQEVLVVLRNEKGEDAYSKVLVDQKFNIIESDLSSKLNSGAYTVVASSDNKLYSRKVYVR
jgi:hypothetical protein